MCAVLVPLAFGTGVPAAAAQPVAVQRVTLSAPDGQAFDTFGEAVAISGDTAVVGAPGDTTPLASGGSAYVYRRSGSAWLPQAKLIAPDAALDDNFGMSVATDGSTIVVGAPYHDNPGAVDDGSAYVFTRSGLGWTLQATLHSSDERGSGAGFGSSVAVSGTTAVIGARDDNPAGLVDAGAAVVFVRSGTLWSEQATLVAADAAADAEFGAAVSLDNGTAVIGAPFDPTAGNYSGKAYVFVGSGANWAQQAALPTPAPAANQRVGFSVAVEGDTALVGALGTTTARGFGAGAAYAFVRSGTDWSAPTQLTASDGSPGDEFGWAVALRNGTAVVGAPGQRSPVGIVVGGAYIFTGSAGAWTQASRLTPAGTGPTAQNGFGSAVSTDGPIALIGALYADGAAGRTKTGAAFCFSRSTSAQPTASGM